ncbi:MAG: TIM barrel protein [Candidatus Limnocylindrales bacterium]|jgi:hydroxypyruvate isomerase
MSRRAASEIITREQARALRFDANLSILFGDRPILERAALAGSAGFDAVEMWWPFSRSVPSDAEVDRLVASVANAGLSLVLLNLDGGSTEAGEHGLLSIPGQAPRFRDNVDVAVDIAGRLGGRVFNALYGNVNTDVPEALQRSTAEENLAYAARRAATVGARIVLEPLNPVDFPRYGLRTIEQAIELSDRVRSEADVAVDVLFDVYNVQRTQGDLLRRIAEHADRFGHVQIADVPARLHPGTGEIAFGPVFEGLTRAGYRGYVGLEYRPSLSPDDTFGWLPRAWRSSRRQQTAPK